MISNYHLEEKNLEEKLSVVYNKENYQKLIHVVGKKQIKITNIR